MMSKHGWRAVLALGSLGLGGCMCSFGGGMTSAPVAPWTFRTEYAWWDAKRFHKYDGGLEVVDISPDAGGLKLNVELYGFTFHPQRDRRTWNAEEWHHFKTGMNTQPVIFVGVDHAAELANGSTLEFDSEADGGRGSGPILSVNLSEGQPPLGPNATYPDKPKPYGSRVKATLEITQATKTAGPLSTVMGNLEVSVEKGARDGDVRTGTWTSRFTAPVVSERLAECNWQTTYQQLLGVYYQFFYSSEDRSCDTL